MGRAPPRPTPNAEILVADLLPLGPPVLRGRDSAASLLTLITSRVIMGGDDPKLPRSEGCGRLSAGASTGATSGRTAPGSTQTGHAGRCGVVAGSSSSAREPSGTTLRRPCWTAQHPRE